MSITYSHDSVPLWHCRLWRSYSFLGSPQSFFPQQQPCRQTTHVIKSETHLHTLTHRWPFTMYCVQTFGSKGESLVQLTYTGLNCFHLTCLHFYGWHHPDERDRERKITQREADVYGWADFRGFVRGTVSFNLIMLMLEDLLNPKRLAEH